MLRLRPTYEEMLREAKTRRLRILPERERRTQQGMLLEDVDFDDFDLDKYDKKVIIMNENPQKGTQTDFFDKMFSSETSESMKSVDEEAMESQEEQETTQDKQPEQEEPERERGKSMMRRIYDNLFGHDECQEEREELLNRRTQREAEEEEEQTEQMEEEEDDLPMNVKKSYEPSSSSSSNSSSRSALLPIEEGALSEHIQSSAPISVQSSVRSDRTIEYIEESPIASVISSRRSQETIEYIRSRSSSSRSYRS